MFSLALAAAVFVGVQYPYYAAGWMAADGPRPPPQTVLVKLACGSKLDGGPPGCGDQAWANTLKDYHEQPLTAPAGGRSYRVILLSSFYSSNPSLYRLDVDASGAGQLHMVSLQTYRDKVATERYADQTVMVKPGQVQAFEAALDKSLFFTDPPKAVAAADGAITMHLCLDGVNVAVEAIKGDQYRWVVDPCGGEVKLGLALGVLAGVDHQPW
jgi:hypothetical protein